MLVLGIDPGSIRTGWALLKMEGKKVHYVTSGVLHFNKDLAFLDRLTDIKIQTQKLILDLSPAEVALESLIYVKSPTALIKLAQARGIILSTLVEKYQGKIFEYSPNFVKASAVGHGHANKESMRKVLDMLLGRHDYATHDESDAVAIALCHILNRNSARASSAKPPSRGKRGKSLAASLEHKVGSQ